MPFAGYECDGCGAIHGPDEAEYRCPGCGGNLFVRSIDSGTTREAIERSADRSMWRYAPLLAVPPAGPEHGVMASVGGTPLVPAHGAARRLGVKRLWLKDEGRMPTGSLKDRASAAVVRRAAAIGVDRVITASTGNAGVALAAMARAGGLDAVILVPASAPAAKLAQLGIFDATVVLVRGSYDDAFELSVAASRELGWYCRNTGLNPFTVEGKKTVSFEIAEQLGWRAPDRIFVPVGDGNIIVAVHRGFAELLALGWIDRMPRLVGVQAAGSSPIARAFLDGADHIEPVITDTLADSIAAGHPADGLRALRAVRETAGAFVIVSDEDILRAIVSLGREAAIFAEPAAAAAWAGLCAASSAGQVGDDEDVVVLVTGTGLKDVPAATRALGAHPSPIEPTLEALRTVLDRRANP